LIYRVKRYVTAIGKKKSVARSNDRKVRKVKEEGGPFLIETQVRLSPGGGKGGEGVRAESLPSGESIPTERRFT